MGSIFGGEHSFSNLYFDPNFVSVRNTVVQLVTSMWMVVDSNPAQTELASTFVRSKYRLRFCSPNYLCPNITYWY